MITAWIPAQYIPIEMGPLTFAKPLEVYKLVENIKFNEYDTSYDRKIKNVFKNNHVSIVEEPFELGGKLSSQSEFSFCIRKQNNSKSDCFS